MVGRNDLCPCGSGRKYKKCCLAKDEAKEIARNKISYATTQYDAVIKKIEEFSEQEKYNGLKEKCGLDFELKDSELEAINTYYFCDYKYDKQTSILMDYFNAKKDELAESEKSIIDNLRNSYVGVYQIKEKDINKIVLKDVLLDENIYVDDINLFKDFEAGNCVLARILNVGGTKIFLDNTFEIDDSKKEKIITIINKRYSENKKKFKNKKNCLANNIRFMYKNIVEIYKSSIRKEEVEDNTVETTEENILEESKTEKIDIDETNYVESSQNQTLDINQEAFLVAEEELEKEEILVDEEACLTESKTSKKRVVMARKATHKAKNKLNKKLEEKLKERLEKTKRIMQKKEIEYIPVDKEQVEESNENKNLIKIEAEKDNSKEVEENFKFKLEECSVYKLLISKVELEYREKCIDIWKKFLEKCENYNGNENGWVSALEYSVRKEIDESVTQGQISKKYGVSQKTLGKRYKELQGY